MAWHQMRITYIIGLVKINDYQILNNQSAIIKLVCPEKNNK